MYPLEAGAVHQAMPQGIIEHVARTVEQVQRGTDRPLMNDQCKALGEVIPVTEDMRARGGVMWARGKHSRRFGLQGCTEYRAFDKVRGHSGRTLKGCYGNGHSL